MRLALIAVLATGCSSVLGFEDFSGPDGGGSDGRILRVSGQVTDQTGTQLANVGVDASDRNGNQIGAPTNTSTNGGYMIDLPLTDGSVDGFLHFSTGGYFDSYVHFPGPLTQNRRFDLAMGTGSDINSLHSQVGTARMANTSVMVIDTVDAGVSVVMEGGQVFYYDGVSGALTAGLTNSGAARTAVVLNIPDGIYHPHRSTKPAGRAYGVEPNSIVSITLE